VPAAEDDAAHAVEVTAVEAAFATGSQDVLRLAYEAHGPVVFGFCRRALDADRAADATQEVFTSAWRNRAGYDPAKGSLRGWLLGIARYKVLGVLRRPHPTPVEVQEEVDVTSAGEVDRMADRMVVARALTELPERARRHLLLAYVDGLSHAEIADQTDLPLGTVKSDIRRALLRLRHEIGGLDG
jgi:RNA polymerase sigma-70 factor (ECF subfamily)